MNIKKITVVTMAALLSISLMAGCNKTTKEPVSSGTPEIKVKPELKFLHTNTSFDISADPAVKAITDITGYKITYDLLPAQNPLDKLNILMASGSMDYDYVHMQYMGDDASKNVYASYAKKGQIVQLDEKIKKYPNIAKFPALNFEPIKVDGKIYALPTTGLPTATASLMFRKDWLDAIGKTAPTTSDELYTVLKLFKDKDPGKLGVKNLPFATGTGFNTAIGSLFGITLAIEPVNGKIIDHRVNKEYKEYLTFMNKLYTEKLLDQDYPLGADISKKIVAGTVGFYTGWVDPAKDFLVAMNKEGNTTAKYMAAAPFKRPDGKQQIVSGSGFQDYGFIPASSKNVDAVLDYINTFLEPKNFEPIAIGLQGTDWELKDGKKYPILPRFTEQKNNMYVYIPAVDGDTYYPTWTTRTRKQAEYITVYEDIMNINQKYLVKNEVNYSPALASGAQTKKLVEDYITQESIKFIAGARPLSEFDKFVEEVNSKGEKQILDDLNAWYSNSSIKK